MKYLIYISSKLEPYFYHLIYMSIVALIIGIVILVIKKFADKKISPKWISRIWLIFIISLIIPTTIKSKASIYNILPNMQDLFYNINYSRKAEEVEQYKEEIVNEYEMQSPKVSPQDNIFKFSREDLDNSMKEFEKAANPNYLFILLPIIWQIIVILLIMAYIITYIIFEIKLHKSEIVKSDNINKILENCKRKLKIKKKIKLINQNLINMPSILGIFNTKILINNKLLELSDKEIEYILMHELSHYKRKDNLLNTLITILKCIYIFNPIIIILLDEVKKDLEVATDELAMQFSDDQERKEYCKTLVMLSTMNFDKYLIQTLCLTNGKKSLEKRIDNLNLLSNFKKNSKLITAISILLLVFIIFVFDTKSSNYMSKNEIIGLIRNGYNHNNYFVQMTHIPIFNDENLQEYIEQYTFNIKFYYKNDISVTKREEHYNNNESINISYNNYNTKECISIYSSNNNKSISVDKFQTEDKIYETFIKKLEYANNYKFCGEEEIDSKKVYVVEIVDSDTYNYDLTHNIFGIQNDKNVSTLYIDKQTGLVLKLVNQYFYKDKINSNFEEEYEYKFDIVTEEDVKWPDLNDYKDYEKV